MTDILYLMPHPKIAGIDHDKGHFGEGTHSLSRGNKHCLHQHFIEVPPSFVNPGVQPVIFICISTWPYLKVELINSALTMNAFKRTIPLI